jgi:hypothetical protein
MLVVEREMLTCVTAMAHVIATLHTIGMRYWGKACARALYLYVT